MDNYVTDTDKYREIYEILNNLDKNYPKNLKEYILIQQEKEEQINFAKQQNEQARKDFFNSISENMVLVVGGAFVMGSKKGDKEEKPVHTVTVNTFSISKYAVTVAQYKKICETTGTQMPDMPRWGWIDDHPMVNVSWSDAITYTKWLSKELGGSWRLPTEAEWEYAARGGNQSRGYTYSGSNNLDEVDSDGDTYREGTKKANELGLYDMTGNVWEWCSDLYDEKYYAKSPSYNPTGPYSESRYYYSGSHYYVARGGCSGFNSVRCRIADRYGCAHDTRQNSVGFRVVYIR